jgi:uroporphyrin-III C-methyltransferase/precorrin-2 dehydrogenase/sirohydrochlorin ferrochelatase
LSELETLVKNNISYEIVPGVTAASGAAAYAGIPLTARGFASSVRFVAHTHPELLDEHQVNELASTDDTLVLYMSSKNLSSLVSRLLKNGISNEKWIAIVEQATTPNQRVFAFPVNEFTENERAYKSPAIVIIGKVAKLHEKFQWNQEQDKDGNFFPSVEQEYLKAAKVA